LHVVQSNTFSSRCTSCTQYPRLCETGWTLKLTTHLLPPHLPIVTETVVHASRNGCSPFGSKKFTGELRAYSYRLPAAMSSPRWSRDKKRPAAGLYPRVRR